MNIPLCAAALVVVFMAPSSAGAQNAATIYKARCVGCHGADGKGNTPPGKALGARDFGSAEVASMGDADLIKVITDGKDKMPAYGKSLKETEIRDLMAYVRQLGKPK